MYKTLDLTKYILNFCNKNNIEINNPKLQEVLYYIQISFYSILGKPAFIDMMKTSAIGLITPDIYHRYYQHVWYPLREIYPDFKFKFSPLKKNILLIKLY